MKIFITIICVFVGYMHISAQTGEIENEAERIPILSEFDILFSGITPEEYYKDYIPEIIPEYFILGTLDYSIRPGGLGANDIDVYNKNQDNKVKFLQNYIRDNFHIDIQIKRNEYGLFYLHSPELEEIISSKFTSGSELKTDIFTTQEQMGSFLLGVYFRHGGKRDKTYSINLSINSKLIFSLLRDMECRKILFSESAPAIGGGYGGFDFYPSALLKKYFDEYLIMQEKIQNPDFDSPPQEKIIEAEDREEKNKKSLEEMDRQEEILEQAFGIYEYFRK